MKVLALLSTTVFSSTMQEAPGSNYLVNYPGSTYLWVISIYIIMKFSNLDVCATIYTEKNQSGLSAALPIGESNHGLPGQSPSVMPLHDRSKSVSVSSVKGIISHALNGFEIRNPSICQNYVRFLI